jgi:hypothetical protein
MFFLSESASDEVMGCRAVIHSKERCHVEMVGSSRPTGGWLSASLFKGFFQSSRLGHSVRG